MTLSSLDSVAKRSFDRSVDCIERIWQQELCLEDKAGRA